MKIWQEQCPEVLGTSTPKKVCRWGKGSLNSNLALWENTLILVGDYCTEQITARGIWDSDQNRKAEARTGDERATMLRGSQRGKRCRDRATALRSVRGHGWRRAPENGARTSPSPPLARAFGLRAAKEEGCGRREAIRSFKTPGVSLPLKLQFPVTIAGTHRYSGLHIEPTICGFTNSRVVLGMHLPPPPAPFSRIFQVDSHGVGARAGFCFSPSHPHAPGFPGPRGHGVAGASECPRVPPNLRENI